MSLNISATDISWTFNCTRNGNILAEQWGNTRIDLSSAPTSQKSKYTLKKKSIMTYFGRFSMFAPGTYRNVK